MLTPEALVADESWIPYDTVAFADGRLILLDPYEGEAGLSFTPVVESTLASYLEFNPDGLSSLTEQWRQQERDLTLVGGGGSFEEDGYVALFEGGKFVWLFFSTRTGPTLRAQVTDDAVLVCLESGVWLRLSRERPYIVSSHLLP
jgi:hypothetical protein